MKSYFVGIDIAKKTLDWNVHNHELKGQVKNTLEGMSLLIKQLSQTGISPVHCWFCFEHTGNYGLLLCSFLEHQGILYSVVPALQIKKSIGITRGKNDQIDAQRIAQYAYTFREELKPSQLPGQVILQVKQLLAHRQILVKASTQEKNSLKELTGLQSLIDISVIAESKEKHLKLLREQIRLIEITIVKTLAQDEAIQHNLDLIRSIKGIGLTIAAYLLVTTANFTQFDTARQYNCYTGIAPFECSSGTSLQGKTRVSHLGNKTVKALLYNGAYVAVRYDPELNQYYHKKRAEKKHTQSVINAVACKLVARAFAVVKRGSPYVITYQQKMI
jgi:transposase